MHKKTIFERLIEGEIEDASSESEADSALEEAAQEYLDYIEGRAGKRTPKMGGDTRFPMRGVPLGPKVRSVQGFTASDRYGVLPRWPE